MPQIYNNQFFVETVTGTEERIAYDSLNADARHFVLQNNTRYDLNVLLFNTEGANEKPAEFGVRAGGILSVPYDCKYFEAWTAQTEPPGDAIPPAGSGGTYVGPGRAPSYAIGYIQAVAFDEPLSMFSAGETINSNAQLSGSLPAGTNNIGLTTPAVNGVAVSNANPLPTTATVNVANVTLTGSNAIYNGTYAVTGTGAAIATSQACSAVVVVNDPSSNGTIYVGGSSAQTIPLSPGQSKEYQVSNVDMIYAKFASGTTSATLDWEARS